MFIQLTALIVDHDENNRNELAQFLSGHGVTPLGAYANVEQLTQHLGKTEKPQVVIVNLDPGALDNLKSIAALIRQHHEVAFFVMSQVIDPNLIMEAMHVGAKEFIPLPIQELKFRAALERLSSTFGMASKGTIINVIPTMGGVGSTSIASNVAASLAKRGKTVIVDLDLVRGGVASQFDVRPRYTMADVMQQSDQIDRQVIDNTLAIHQKSGLAILARPDMPEDSQRVTHQGIQRLFNVLGRMFDYIVVDSMMDVSPTYASVIGASTLNLIVMQLNVPSARNAERFVGALRRMGVEGTKMKIIVNRYEKKGWDIAPEDVERSLGLKLAWMVPNDFRNAIAAVNFGEPVVLRAPRSDMAQSLAELSQFIADGPGKAVAA
jgi:pilus assembly protein CpaE